MFHVSMGQVVDRLKGMGQGDDEIKRFLDNPIRDLFGYAPRSMIKLNEGRIIWAYLDKVERGEVPLFRKED